MLLRTAPVSDLACDTVHKELSHAHPLGVHFYKAGMTGVHCTLFYFWTQQAARCTCTLHYLTYLHGYITIGVKVDSSRVPSKSSKGVRLPQNLPNVSPYHHARAAESHLPQV